MLDILLVPGDFVAHGVAIDLQDPDKGNYETLEETLG
jgi:hypothetical protein